MDGFVFGCGWVGHVVVAVAGFRRLFLVHLTPLWGDYGSFGFVVETDGRGARLGRGRTRLFLACFLSHFRKRRQSGGTPCSHCCLIFKNMSGIRHTLVEFISILDRTSMGWIWRKSQNRVFHSLFWWHPTFLHVSPLCSTRIRLFWKVHTSSTRRYTCF